MRIGPDRGASAEGEMGEIDLILISNCSNEKNTDRMSYTILARPMVSAHALPTP